MQRNQRSNSQHPLDHWKSNRISEIHVLLFHWLCWSLWLWGSFCFFSTKNCGKFFKRWEYQITLTASYKTCMYIKKQKLEPDMKQQTGSRLVKKYIKAVYCHPAYLTYIQSTSCEMLGRMKHKLESRLQGEITITSDMQMTPPLWQKAKRN